MTRYYYFAAALPLLLYHEPPRISHGAFMEAAGRLISKRDCDALRAARLDNFDTAEKISPLFTRFQEWEINLRNRLAALRAAARKEEGAPFQRKARVVVETARAARNAFEAANPLLGEEVLNRARWEFLSNLAGLHQFDLGFLLLYSLKLQLLERQALLAQDIGAARHEALEADLDRELAERIGV